MTVTLVEVILTTDGRHEKTTPDLSAQHTATVEQQAMRYVSHFLPNEGKVSGKLAIDVNDNGEFISRRSSR